MYHAPHYLRAPLCNRIPQLHVNMSFETVSYIQEMNSNLWDYRAKLADIRATEIEDTNALVQRFSMESLGNFGHHVKWYNSYTMMRQPIGQLYQIATYENVLHERMESFVRARNEIDLKAMKDRASTTRSYNDAVIKCVEDFRSHVAEERINRKAQKKIEKAERVEKCLAKVAEAIPPAPVYQDPYFASRLYEVNDMLCNMRLDGSEIASSSDESGISYDPADFDFDSDSYGNDSDC